MNSQKLSKEAEPPLSEPHEIESPGESGTCVLGDQTDLRVGQSPLPGTGEEYPLAPDQLWLGESVRRAAPAADGSLVDVYANKGPGSPTAGDTQERCARTGEFPVEGPC